MRDPRLGIIFGIAFLDLLGFGILIPQLGIYGLKLQASPLMVGLLLAVYSLMQLLFAPILGSLSDRYGRRPVLLYSMAGSFVGYMLFAFAQSLEVLFLARIIDGISGANISTAQAYVADITKPEDRAKGMGMIGAAFGLGFVLGPGIGGVLGAWGGNLAIGLGAGSLCAVNWVLAYFRLPESRKPDKAPTGPPSEHRLRLRHAFSALRMPQAGFILSLSLLYMIAFAQMEGTFSVFLVERFSSGFSAGVQASVVGVTVQAEESLLRLASFRAGLIFVSVGIVSAIVQGGLMGRLKKRFGEKKLAVFGLGLAGAALSLVPWAPSYYALFAPMTVLAAGAALVNPSLSALASLNAPPGEQGRVLGAYQSMGALGRVLGPSLGGLLYGLFGAGAPFWTSGLILLLCAILGLRLRMPAEVGMTSQHESPRTAA